MKLLYCTHIVATLNLYLKYVVFLTKQGLIYTFSYYEKIKKPRIWKLIISSSDTAFVLRDRANVFLESSAHNGNPPYYTTKWTSIGENRIKKARTYDLVQLLLSGLWPGMKVTWCRDFRRGSTHSSPRRTLHSRLRIVIHGVKQKVRLVCQLLGEHAGRSEAQSSLGKPPRQPSPCLSFRVWRANFKDANDTSNG